MNLFSPADKPSRYPSSARWGVLVPQSHWQDVHWQGSAGAGKSHQVPETPSAQRQSRLLHHSLRGTGVYLWVLAFLPGDFFGLGQPYFLHMFCCPKFTFPVFKRNSFITNLKKKIYAWTVPDLFERLGIDGVKTVVKPQSTRSFPRNNRPALPRKSHIWFTLMQYWNGCLLYNAGLKVSPSVRRTAICEEKNDNAKNFEGKMLVSHSRRADIPSRAALLLVPVCPFLLLANFHFKHDWYGFNQAFPNRWKL